ncbi:hypothetical protein PAECIP111893_03586 [Paenibacillus plantiphilus]|uniref:HTH LytTR-type domain-containing protein n=1 Tax=Paenibacillus plantiphilus TaxID=2905650 RepID=A0ABN8GMB1_9BACL|nr:LytTR family transcriptional regulator DNA-binding domain-containing protein [Paenibacillus plantiphilus]CAH1212712.1 hypothetical protein PAECIP111893_03586 [Paenibacillus plantiphilus]
MELTVTGSRDGSGGLLSIDVRDIIFFEYIGGSEAQIRVHKLHETFYTMGTLRYWVTALQASGFEFALVDRNNAVNIRSIKRLDSQFKIAYFEEEITRDSKYCTLAWEKYKALVKKLKSIDQPVIIT